MGGGGRRGRGGHNRPVIFDHAPAARRRRAPGEFSVLVRCSPAAPSSAPPFLLRRTRREVGRNDTDDELEDQTSPSRTPSGRSQFPSVKRQQSYEGCSLLDERDRLRRGLPLPPRFTVADARVDPGDYRQREHGINGVMAIRAERDRSRRRHRGSAEAFYRVVRQNRSTLSTLGQAEGRMHRGAMSTPSGRRLIPVQYSKSRSRQMVLAKYNDTPVTVFSPPSALRDGVMALSGNATRCHRRKANASISATTRPRS